MQFKAPKTDIFWWSILWLVLGLLLLVYGPIRGDLSLAGLGLVALVSFLLVWLDQKWFAPPVIILYLLSAVARLITLFLKGFTLAGVAKLIMPIYFAYLFWEWYRSDDQSEQTISTGPRRSPTSPFDTPQADDRWSNPYQGNRQDAP